MTEKSFAATPLTCHEAILEVHKIMQKTFENCIMAFDRILLKSKDFEGIHVPVYRGGLIINFLMGATAHKPKF